MTLDQGKDKINGLEVAPIAERVDSHQRSGLEAFDLEGAAVKEYATARSDEVELQALRSQVESMGGVESKPIEKKVSITEPTTSSVIRNLMQSTKSKFQRMRYPGDEDSSKTFIRSVLPVLSGQIIALVPMFMRTADVIRYSSGAVAQLNPVLEQITSVVTPIGVGLNVMLWLGLGKYVYESKSETKNKHLFGKLLTINKTKTVKNSAVGKTFPEIPDPYYGEMHFLGKAGKKGESTEDIFKQDPIKILRQGLRDLLVLAQACKDNAPDLEGLNVFVGPYSPLITESLKKFGFEIRKPKYNEKWIDKIFEFIPDYLNKIAYKESGIREIDRPSMACMITRETLIKQIPTLEKYANH